MCCFESRQYSDQPYLKNETYIMLFTKWCGCGKGGQVWSDSTEVMRTCKLMTKARKEILSIDQFTVYCISIKLMAINHSVCPKKGTKIIPRKLTLKPVWWFSDEIIAPKQKEGFRFSDAGYYCSTVSNWICPLHVQYMTSSLLRNINIYWSPLKIISVHQSRVKLSESQLS